MERRAIFAIPSKDYIDAWRSHATLERQAGSRFSAVIDAIAKVVHPRETLAVPYITRVWYAQKIS